MSVEIIHGDCRTALEFMPSNSVHSVVTDPPYALVSVQKRFGKPGSAPAQHGRDGLYARASAGFMGKTWDTGETAFDPAFWYEVLRVLKPGGHVLAFGGTRTYHRLACAIEDAGFEIRDSIMWHYASGFPKSHNVFKQLQTQGLACGCHKTMVSSHYVRDEDVRGLQDALDAHNAVSGDAQSDVQQDVRRSADFAAEGGSAEDRPVDSVCDLRNAGASAPVASKADQSGVLQPVLPVEDICGAAEAVRGEHEGPQAATSLRAAEPRLEGRRDAQEAARELFGSPVRTSASVGSADGAEGRVHHGAPSAGGADVRVPAAPHGGGASQGPRPGKQRTKQSRTVADERGPQAWGGWPVCSGCGKPIIPEGYGTALKPATEIIVVARKALDGTNAQNLARWGVGALNIDGCRVPAEAGGRPARSNAESASGLTGTGGAATYGSFAVRGSIAIGSTEEGRWPANVIHDGSEEVLSAFPAAPGQLADESRTAPSAKTAQAYGAMKRQGEPSQDSDNEGGVGFKMKPGARRLDSGSAARFFYCAKASKKDRDDGLDGFTLGNNMRVNAPRLSEDAKTATLRANTHPTVKPTDLMRYLCRLVTPPGGTVLDPFMGSGSTGRGAVLEGFNFIGCEMEAEYTAIARARIAAVQPEDYSKTPVELADEDVFA